MSIFGRIAEFFETKRQNEARRQLELRVPELEKLLDDRLRRDAAAEEEAEKWQPDPEEESKFLAEIDKAVAEKRNLQGLATTERGTEAVKREMTWLHYAAASGYSQGVEKLLSLGVPVDVRPPKGNSYEPELTMTPLYFAFTVPVVELLLGAGADPNAISFGMLHFDAPLHKAKLSKIAGALISAGARPDIHNGGRITPLRQHFFTKMHVSDGERKDINTELVKVLLEGGANPNCLDGELHSPVWQAIPDVACVYQLYKHGAICTEREVEKAGEEDAKAKQLVELFAKEHAAICSKTTRSMTADFTEKKVGKQEIEVFSVRISNNGTHAARVTDCVLTVRPPMGDGIYSRKYLEQMEFIDISTGKEVAFPLEVGPNSEVEFCCGKEDVATRLGRNMGGHANLRGEVYLEGPILCTSSCGLSVKLL